MELYKMNFFPVNKKNEMMPERKKFVQDNYIYIYIHGRNEKKIHFS